MKATIFAQREQVENAETGRRELPAAREVQLITGETVVLYALDTGEMPLADTNQITLGPRRAGAEQYGGPLGRARHGARTGGERAVPLDGCERI